MAFPSAAPGHPVPACEHPKGQPGASESRETDTPGCQDEGPGARNEASAGVKREPGTYEGNPVATAKVLGGQSHEFRKVRPWDLPAHVSSVGAEGPEDAGRQVRPAWGLPFSRSQPPHVLTGTPTPAGSPGHWQQPPRDVTAQSIGSYKTPLRTWNRPASPSWRTEP